MILERQKHMSSIERRAPKLWKSKLVKKTNPILVDPTIFFFLINKIFTNIPHTKAF